MRVRAESFGGLVESDDGIVAVNPAAMRALGVTSALWSKPGVGLSAPIEAQLIVTRRCHAACAYCSVDATPAGAEMSLDAGRRVLDELARRGVFTVAFGGGEPLLHPHLFALAAHARSLGLTITVTTAGLALDDDTAAALAVFHAVHVSLTPHGAPALRTLARSHPCVGVNVLVERGHTNRVDVAAGLSIELGLRAVQVLRLKPAGRARPGFVDLAPADERAVVDAVRRAVAAGVRVRVDCALAPLFHAVSERTIAGASVTVMPDGTTRACVVDEDDGGGHHAPALVRIESSR